MKYKLISSERKFNGKTFYLDCVVEHKSEAQARAERLRNNYKKARVVKVHNYKAGKNWAVFTTRDW